VTDPAAFLAKIVAEPDQDLPRLQYADWLDEHGQPERAEFIRVQVELARIEASPAFLKLADTLRPTLGRVTDGVIALGIEQREDVAALRRREGELLAEHGTAWLAATAPPAHEPWTTMRPVHGPAWRRGFVAGFACTWPDWQAHAAALLAACPIRRVNRLRACDRCGGGIARRVLDAVAYDPCPTCRGTGWVDDWRGDGLVRLTTVPPLHFVDGTEAAVHLETNPIRPRPLTNPARPWQSGDDGRKVILELLDDEYPGVPFELPAAVFRYEPGDDRSRMDAEAAALGREVYDPETGQRWVNEATPGRVARWRRRAGV
jgi:uncharacterized protein (TIGR02996 family)